MAVKKKECMGILDEVKEAIEECFGNRVVAISCGDSSNQWVASHSVMEVRTVVRRVNSEIINNMYDIAYKIMSKNEFNYLISLRVIAYNEEDDLQTYKIIRNKLLSDIGIYREAGIWRVV